MTGSKRRELISAVKCVEERRIMLTKMIVIVAAAASLLGATLIATASASSSSIQARCFDRPEICIQDDGIREEKGEW
jgi:hypothetical protein